jgi:DNA-binding winged helix-turn-helix (wHTH) protein
MDPASTSSARCARPPARARASTRACPSCSCPGAPRRSIASAGSSAGQTTTSRSPSRIQSSACASPRSSGGRASGAAAAALRVGELEIDPASREVRLRGAPVALSQKEFALLSALAAEPTRVFTKHELLRDVWGFRAMGATRTLDSHACRLRHKLGCDGARFVVNVWGVGYRLIDGPVPEAAAAATERALDAVAA